MTTVTITPVATEEVVKTTDDLLRVLSEITFKNTVLDFKWQFEFRDVTIQDSHDGQSGWLVWATFERPDSYNGEMGRGRGRDEIIWAGTTVSGVVKTAWLLVELLVRHELMEGFRWRNVRIFNPHHTVEQLASLRKKKKTQDEHE